MSAEESKNEGGRTGHSTAQDAAGQIKAAIAERHDTDLQIGGWWRFIPAVAVAVGLLTFTVFIVLTGSLVGVVIAFILMWTVTYAVLAILNYRLIKRMNEHARREAALRHGMVDRIISVAEKEGGKETASRVRSVLEPMLHDRAADKPFGIMLSPMTVVPLVGIVAELLVLRDLNRFLPEHDEGWQALLSEWEEASAKHGWRPFHHSKEEVKRRPFAVFYLISLVITPFLIYWYNGLIQEVNGHFRAQWAAEDQLAVGPGS